MYGPNLNFPIVFKHFNSLNCVEKLENTFDFDFSWSFHYFYIPNTKIIFQGYLYLIPDSQISGINKSTKYLTEKKLFNRFFHEGIFFLQHIEKLQNVIQVPQPLTYIFNSCIIANSFTLLL